MLIIAVRYFELLFTPFSVLIANVYISIQRSDDVFARREEKDILSYRFPLTTHNKKIYFKGYFLSISNQQTEDYKTYIDNANTSPTTEYIEYKVPTRYTIYIRVASVYFT